jgi:hypothetical protein
VSDDPVEAFASSPDPDLVVSTTDVVGVSSLIGEAPFLVPGAVWSVAEVRDLAARVERVERVPPSTAPSGASSV